MNRLCGKVALISGGATGLGEAIARGFAAEGCLVVLGDILVEQGCITARELGHAAIFTELDVTRAEDWAAAVAVATATFGRLDVLVNNAGTWAGVGNIGDEDPADHRRILDVNLTGVWNGTRAVIPAMRAAGSGSIVSISSIDGLVGVARVTSYVASKWAVTGITRSTALELGKDNIRVNAIHPGFIATNAWAKLPEAALERYRKTLDTQPIPRMGRPSEVAMAAIYLASDEASYSTGTSLLVDGGHLAGPHRDALDG